MLYSIHLDNPLYASTYKLAFVNIAVCFLLFLPKDLTPRLFPHRKASSSFFYKITYVQDDNLIVKIVQTVEHAITRKQTGGRYNESLFNETYVCASTLLTILFSIPHSINATRPPATTMPAKIVIMVGHIWSTLQRPN